MEMRHHNLIHAELLLWQLKNHGEFGEKGVFHWTHDSREALIILDNALNTENTQDIFDYILSFVNIGITIDKEGFYIFIKFRRSSFRFLTKRSEELCFYFEAVKFILKEI